MNLTRIRNLCYHKNLQKNSKTEINEKLKSRGENA